MRICSVRVVSVCCLREQRASYIRTKYEARRYAIKTCADTEELKQELYQAVATSDIYALLQVFAERVDLLTPLPGEVSGACCCW